VTATFRQAIEKYIGTEVMLVSSGIKTGLNILIDNPAQLGSDRVVVSVAGINEYPVPQIIIDMGTATTFDVIDKHKNHRGGLIMTGMAASMEALVERTSQLPRIGFDPPKKIVCTNTVDSMKSGIIYSNACAVDGLIERIEEEIGERCTVIATGGLAGMVIPLCRRKDIILDDTLLMKGLMIIYNKNKAG
jgi:type III pantothenate kinase